MGSMGAERIAELSPEELLGPLNEIEQKNSPARFYVSGKREIMDSGPRVAVIGSRKASDLGLENAEKIARFLVENNVVVVSGLAEGIDTAAHQAAINNGGYTIAVLGTPLEKAYPAQNKGLQDLIMREHLAISQFPTGSGIHRGNFPMRNRSMALISHSSIIVEAGETSGSLHQGWEALRLGRPLFILESVIGNRSLKWPSEMLKYGAMALSLSKMGEVLEVLLHPGFKLDLDVTI